MLPTDSIKAYLSRGWYMLYPVTETGDKNGYSTAFAVNLTHNEDAGGDLKKGLKILKSRLNNAGFDAAFGEHFTRYRVEYQHYEICEWDETADSRIDAQIRFVSNIVEEGEL